MKPVFCVLFLLVMAGCVPSLQPYYTASDVVFDPSLLGTWVRTDSPEHWEYERLPEDAPRPEGGEVVVVSQRDGQTYHVALHPEGDEPVSYLGRLFAVDGARLLDTYPDTGLDQIDPTRTFPIHTVVWVQQNAPTLRLATLNPDWVSAYLAEHPSALRYEETESGFVLSASSADLRTFLRAHLNTPGAFANPDTLR